MVFCTTYALILPAVTLEGKTYCDKEEHTHTHECYGIVSSNETDMLADSSDQDDESETSAFSSDDQDTENTSHRKLICGKEAHEHTLQCYSNPNLKESRAHWNDSLPDVAEANNSLNELIYLTAHSQLGYNPANEDTHLNYQVQEDGHTKYYWNRYAAFADANNPYVQDNSVFVNFVLKHSDNTLPWKQDVNEWQNLEYIDPYADNNIDASLWQSAWQHISLDQAKRGAIVLFRNEDQSTADIQSSSSFESQPVSTENTNGFAETANSTDFNSSQNSKDPDDSSTDESTAVKIETGILAEDLLAENETATQSSAPESTDPAIEEGFAFDPDFGTDSTSSNPAATESQPIEEVQIISTWKDQKPESRKIPAENIIGVYQVKNDAIDPTHITDDDADGDKNEDQDKDKGQNPAAPDQSQNQTPTTPSDGTGTSTETPGSDPTDPDGSGNGQTIESPTTPGQSTTPTDQNPTNTTDGNTDSNSAKPGQGNKDKNSSDTEDGSTKTEDKTTDSNTDEAATTTIGKSPLKRPQLSLAETGSAATANSNLINTLDENGEKLIANEINQESINQIDVREQSGITVEYKLNYPSTTPLDAAYGRQFAVPTIEPDNKESEVLEPGTNLVLPSLSSYEYRIKWGDNPEKPRATVRYFLGWTIGNDVTTYYQPGESIDWSVLNGLTNSSKSITVTAQWSEQPKKQEGTAVFSVNLGLDVTTDYSNKDANTDNSSWVDGVYSTAVICEKSGNVNYNNFDPGSYDDTKCSASFIAYLSLGNNESTKTDIGTDAEIRKLVRNDETGKGVTGKFVDTVAPSQNMGITKGYTGTYTFRLASFPSDSEIMQQLRKYQADQLEKDNSTTNTKLIRYKNNDPITDSDLINTENFKIVWHVFKLNKDKFWHIDGRLVQRQSNLNVTKHFEGFENLTDNQKNDVLKGFYVEVTDSKSNSQYLTTNGRDITKNWKNYSTLKAKVDETDSNTYTWTIPVNSLEKYTVKEYGYNPRSISNEKNLAILAQYNVINDPTYKDGIQPYTSNGITVTTLSYLPDVKEESYQTINLYNSYLKTSTIQILKVDSTDESLFEGAKFTISKKGDSKFKLYQLNVNNEIYLYPKQVANSTEIPDCSFTTSSSSPVYLMEFLGNDGTYTLSEEIIPGYSKLDDITLEFSKNSASTVTLKGGNNEQVSLSSNNSNQHIYTLKIKNIPEKANLQIQKKWNESTPEDEKLEVRVDLYRRFKNDSSNNLGTKVNAAPIILNKENDWSNILKNQPTYLNGKELEYRILETRIGNEDRNINIDGTVTNGQDGFDNYIVTYDDPIVEIDENNEKNIKMVVNNKKDIAKVSFTKVDGKNTASSLTGATFYLYRNENLTGTPYVARSDSNGTVVFDQLSVGTYYLKEVASPSGYKLNDTVYTLKVTNVSNGKYSFTLTAPEGAEGKLIANPLGDVVEYSIPNDELTLNLSLYKCDQTETHPLSGARFSLSRVSISEKDFNYQNNGFDGMDIELIKDNLISDSNGRIEVTDMDLTAGYYRLEEIHAPDGYYLPNEPLDFQLIPNSTNETLEIVRLYRSKGDPEGPYYRIGDSTSDYDIKVINTTGQKLPDTGGEGTNLYTSGGILLLAASCLLYTFSKKQSYGKGEQ